VYHSISDTVETRVLGWVPFVVVVAAQLVLVLTLQCLKHGRPRGRMSDLGTGLEKNFLNSPEADKLSGIYSLTDLEVQNLNSFTEKKARRRRSYVDNKTFQRFQGGRGLNLQSLCWERPWIEACQ
jgi:hypothetical protein